MVPARFDSLQHSSLSRPCWFTEQLINVPVLTFLVFNWDTFVSEMELVSSGVSKNDCDERNSRSPSSAEAIFLTGHLLAPICVSLLNSQTNKELRI